MLQDMTAKITEGEWRPLPGAMPASVEPDKIYVIPTRVPINGEGTDDAPRYTDNVRYLPKLARAAGLPVEFATPEGKRKYLQEFSVDPNMWALGLAVLTITSEWLVFTVERFIGSRASTQGWTEEEALELPLKVSIAETSTSRHIEIEGTGTEVLDALRILERQSLDQPEGDQGSRG